MRIKIMYQDTQVLYVVVIFQFHLDKMLKHKTYRNIKHTIAIICNNQTSWFSTTYEMYNITETMQLPLSIAETTLKTLTIVEDHKYFVRQPWTKLFNELFWQDLQSYTIIFCFDCTQKWLLTQYLYNTYNIY